LQGPGSGGNASHLIKISSREDLTFVLSEASTLEHMIMCEYLFAAFSLRTGESDGLSAEELELVRKWEGVVTTVAVQEMTHLALVNNMLVSVGSGPYFQHANFPQPSRYFAPNVKLALIPFGEQALRHFLYLERPEGMSIQGVPGFEVLGDLEPAELKSGITPREQYFTTVGNLYRGIEVGFKELSEKYGEDGLFIGGEHTQATEELFGLPGLIRVTDLETATKAVDGIVEMGEGARGDWQNSHFGMFLGVFKEFMELRTKRPEFRPTKPVVAAFTRPPLGMDEVPMITDGFTSKVAGLFNACYSMAIGTLSRFYIHGSDHQRELEGLSNAAVGMMANAIKPLGNLLTTLPVGSRLPGVCAGPSFELQHREYTLPHREQAFMVIQERLLELAEYAGALGNEAGGASAARELKTIQSSLADLAKTLRLD
jgi:Ferritin-like